jgi:two-component system cell cycle response regulator CpdR
MHKILLAEDDNDMRRFLVKALENAGFQVSPHDNGMSAYQRLREEPFEMLLTDIMFITGFAAVALNSDSEAPKNAKVLAKPVHLRELVSEVNKMLAA